MRTSFRQAVFATTAIIGMSSFGAAVSLAAENSSQVDTSHKSSVQQIPSSGQKAHRNRIDRAEEQITALHAQLKITAAETPQWDQFAQVMRDNAESMEQTFQNRVKMLPTMNAVENMKSYAQVAMEHAQGVEKLVPAFDALYDKMSDSQKKVADDIFRDKSHNGNKARHGSGAKK